MLRVQEPNVASQIEANHHDRPGTFIVLSAIGALLFGACVWQFRVTGQLPFLHRESVWSIAMYEGPTPFDLAPISVENKPVLTAADVDDVPALFVADPFMIEHESKWYMFVEVLNSDTHQGDIGLATSSDGGLNWNYEQIVLDESFHLSYPSVFQWDGKWYMLPQTNSGVHFYEAESFPTTWRMVHTVLDGGNFADPTLFRHDGMWWMFVGRSGTHDYLQLFSAEELAGQWTEHPQSPLIKNDAETARPGGPVVNYKGELIRLAQDCAPKYGNQLRGFKITKLNRQEYAEEPIDSGTVLTAGSHGWNANGMHHSDAHQREDGRWRSVVDGHKKIWTLQLTP